MRELRIDQYDSGCAQHDSLLFSLLLTCSASQNNSRCNCGHSQGIGITVEGSNPGLGYRLATKLP